MSVNEGLVQHRAGPVHLPDMLLDQEKNKGEINELDLNHIVLEMKTKFLPIDIQKNISFYLPSYCSLDISIVLYDGCD